MMPHIIRDYNVFAIDEVNGILHKKSKKERLSNEMNFYREINKTKYID